MVPNNTATAATEIEGAPSRAHWAEDDKVVASSDIDNEHGHEESPSVEKVSKKVVRERFVYTPPMVDELEEVVRKIRQWYRKGYVLLEEIADRGLTRDGDNWYKAGNYNISTSGASANDGRASSDNSKLKIAD